MNAGYEIQLLCDKNREQAFTVLTELFVSGSAVHRCLSIQLDEYRDYLRPFFDHVIQQHLSLVAVDSREDKIVGVLLACDYVRQTATDEESTPDRQTVEQTRVREKMAPLAALLNQLRRQLPELQQVAAGDLLLVDMAAVAPATQQRGIYRKLREHAHSQAANRGFTRVLGELSSLATQKVCLQHFGHRQCAAIALADFYFKGALPFASISRPEMIVSALGPLVGSESATG